MLELRDIQKSYQKDGRTLPVLAGASIRVEQGRFVAVRGPSGSGKSTCLLIAGALLRPDAGTVLLDGRDPYSLPADERASLRARQIGFMFQQFHLVPYLSVRDNVLAAALPLKGSQAEAAIAGQRPNHDADNRADELLERLGLADRAGHYPEQLSVGQRQRTALARAMLNGPSLLLADEPTGNLDPESSAVVLAQLRELAAAGAAVMMVSHSPAAAAAADEVYELRDGRLLKA